MGWRVDATQLVGCGCSRRDNNAAASRPSIGRRIKNVRTLDALGMTWGIDVVREAR
jgi:hypothetical protein